LDEVGVRDVQKFEQGLLGALRSKNKKLLDTIAKDKKISDETREKLHSAIGDYAKTFAA